MSAPELPEKEHQGRLLSGVDLKERLVFAIEPLDEPNFEVNLVDRIVLQGAVGPDLCPFAVRAVEDAAVFRVVVRRCSTDVTIYNSETDERSAALLEHLHGGLTWQPLRGLHIDTQNG